MGLTDEKTYAVRKVLPGIPVSGIDGIIVLVDDWNVIITPDEFEAAAQQFLGAWCKVPAGNTAHTLTFVLGTIPANSLLLGMIAVLKTVFNSSDTNLIDIGKLGALDDVLSALPVSGVSVPVMLDVSGATQEYADADYAVLATFHGGSAAPTTGKVYLGVRYIQLPTAP